ncbi:MAG: adenylosuccinate lyase [Demequinaceae bacterium]|nr:adenylosuccinate lyase [Demequinaceae bacterium]
MGRRYRPPAPRTLRRVPAVEKPASTWRRGHPRHPGQQDPSGPSPWNNGPVTRSWRSLADIDPAIPLGPLDGRYRSVVLPLVDHLSEAALNRARLLVEVEWLVHLAGSKQIPGVSPLSDDECTYLRRLPEAFGEAEIADLAETERVTVHDVKAVEYLLKKRLADAADTVPGSSLPALTELVHFACTSEDINNLAYALSILGAVTEVWLPAARTLVEELAGLAREHADLAMLSHTHGQPATPTTLGKEIAVLTSRLSRQLHRIDGQEYLGKINGATGTFAAHAVAVPKADWVGISRTFVEGLGLTWNPLTTQIEPHDWQAELYADIARFNRILHNLATDVWTYISLGYFAQVRGQGTVGSSTMPHKVNPIRFENAEANLEISSALLDSLAATLLTSRLQRDLTDSSTQRNIGVALGHSLLAIKNVRLGLAGLDVDPAALARDLDGNWEVLGEAIQTAMRAASLDGVPGMDNPYERLKELTRGRKVDAEALREFVLSLGLPDDVSQRLAGLTPSAYTGLASQLVSFLLD